ncbi:hypothetical protein BB560_004592 [Smittium megazygosporum]|uniref:mitogen-activated protein kinase kinase n=1 Tax=Smittium megazygosporum TaxID=133381 RepID=A0A2T9Z8T1_9FUNG|nr:hypothetical protein BB560_004592 [Smittium megazygosporum]
MPPKVEIPVHPPNSTLADFSSSAASRKQSRDMFEDYLSHSNDFSSNLQENFISVNSLNSKNQLLSAKKNIPSLTSLDTRYGTVPPSNEYISGQIFPSLASMSSSSSSSSFQARNMAPPPLLPIKTLHQIEPSLSSNNQNPGKILPSSDSLPYIRPSSRARRKLETGGDLDASDSEASNSSEEYILNEKTTKTLSKLGEGAVGTVYKICHITTGKLMARKSVDVYPDETTYRQLVRELSFLKYCDSPHIVKFYGASFIDNEDGQSIYMYMEYCDAGSLHNIYKKVGSMNGRIGEGVLGKVAEAVLNGLVYLHKNRIIHRDIKPSNILLTGSGGIKLCDFGVSGELVDSIAQTFVGTSYYMAPERIQGAGYSVKSDVWSLGLTLMEVARGRFPFPEDSKEKLTVIELLDYIVRMPIPSLPKSQFSPEFIDFTNSCLIKNADNRPTPSQLLEHPFIVKSQKNNLDLESWIMRILSS